MLIRYEYELLSSILENGITKIDGNIVVTTKRIEEELIDDKFNEYLQVLQFNGIVDYNNDRICILVENWIDFFLIKLSEVFRANNMNVVCNKLIIPGEISKEFYVDFILNGANKSFKLIFNNLDKQEGNIIFMCIPDIYNCGIYWIELINNINLLNQFYLYLKSESNNINKNAYRQINIFDGIDDKYISEIFNVSIKEYFSDRGYKIKYFIKDECDIIKNIIQEDDITYFAVEFNEVNIWLIKNNKKIIFISIKNKELIYDKQIESKIDDLQIKLTKKISEFKSLILFKENNILDSILKTIGKVNTFFIPISMIISLLAFLNINIVQLIQYKVILIIIIVILAILQYYIIKVVLLPIFKLSKFTWKIK
ncbi:hypothetical protein [Clostridium butyricum]|uniref:hypothetical protein n=1 Tax=Clostridium butyricum TaxID=1492 RepID=UPI00071E9F8B|nr:hypothetical protein [Clostridium butyricum]ALS17347.1 hypothetical protein ATD26_10850 [Clostridium butyricum]MDM8132988.1 hypothetical protein [Clostridium butyricum]MDM8231677.1 hypothetical protein [Clostridium butyricum]